ncbi:MAG: hypothetical protein HQL01_02620 [Nitrospirae bacterium]|nr:hypothetical protein [Nitrospirota bacterium]
MKVLQFTGGLQQQQVTWDDFHAKSNLPDIATIIRGDKDSNTPSEGASGSSPNIDDFMAYTLAPQLSHKEILTPRHYNALVDNTHDTLASIVKELEGEGGTPNDKQKNKKDKLKKVLTLLEEEKQLHALLHAYKSLILQG